MAVLAAVLVLSDPGGSPMWFDLCLNIIFVFYIKCGSYLLVVSMYWFIRKSCANVTSPFLAPRAQ